jgi:putative oxidoreductase
MSTSSRFQSLSALADKIAMPVVLLLTRLVFGQSFAQAGWGKFMDLEVPTRGFENIGIPMAGVMAPFIATVEFVGGLLLILGLGTRIAALFLTATMVVALLTAHFGELAQIWPFSAEDKMLAKISPVPFLIGVLLLLAKGPGRPSLDHVIAKKQARS